MRIKSLFLLFLFGVTACATETVREADFLPWDLPDGQTREVVQLLDGRYGDKPFTLQIRLSMREDKMLIAGVDPLGRRAFDILWDDAGVRAVKADWISEELNAVDILKVIVATYWPENDPMQEKVRDRAGNLEINYQSRRDNAWNETVQISDSEVGYVMTIVSYELPE